MRRARQQIHKSIWKDKVSNIRLTYLWIVFGNQGDGESILGLGDSVFVQCRDQNVVKSGGRCARRWRSVIDNLHFAEIVGKYYLRENGNLCDGGVRWTRYVRNSKRRLEREPALVLKFGLLLKAENWTQI